MSSWKKFFQSNHKNPMTNRKKVGRILFFFAMGIFLLFSFRFIYIISIGKVGDVSLDEKTENHFQGSSVVQAKRGAILDRNGNPIATDATSYSVYGVLDKKYKQGTKELYVHADDIDKIADILNQFIGLDKSYVREQLSQKLNRVEFGNKGKGISLEKKTAIENALKQQKITGIYFDAHPARIYPNGVFASYLVGYADLVDKDDESKGLVGKMGIEQAYNKILSGTSGEEIYQKDSKGNPVPGTVVEVKKAINGADVYTTLDSNLQLELEDLLNQTFEETQAENATAMLVDAKNGEILAAGQRPSFNPETREGLESKDGQEPLWRNLLTEDPFEPGSTMKVFTVAAALNQGVFDENATYPAGTMKLYDATINDFDYATAGQHQLTYRQALAHSSNVGMVKLEQMMGGEVWKDYLKKFGFAQSTNSKLSSENKGQLPGSNIVDVAMSAYGQAISVTDFQMVQGFTTFTNSGTMLQPQYINKIKYADGKEETIDKKVVGQPVSAQAANKTLEMMKDTVEDPFYGTGYQIYNIEGYNVSAKTGTAQIAENGVYTNGALDYLYSVVQIAPTEDPKYIVYVTLKKPQITPTGSPSKEVANVSNQLLKKALDLDVSN